MKDTSAGIEFFIQNTFLSTLWVCNPTACWLPWFVMRHQLWSYWESLWVINHFSCCFQYCLSFDTFIIMCLDVDPFVFILLRCFWSSWLCRLIFSTNLGKFQPLFLQIFYLFQYSPSGIPIMHMLYLVMCHRSMRLCSFFFILFSFLD